MPGDRTGDILHRYDRFRLPARTSDLQVHNRGELKGLAVSSALMGAVILLVADILSKYLVDPALLPVGAVTALIGGPVLDLMQKVFCLGQ